MEQTSFEVSKKPVSQLTRREFREAVRLVKDQFDKGIYLKTRILNNLKASGSHKLSTGKEITYSNIRRIVREKKLKRKTRGVKPNYSVIPKHLTTSTKASNGLEVMQYLIDRGVPMAIAFEAAKSVK